MLPSTFTQDALKLRAEKTHNARGVLDPNDRVELSEISLAGNARTQASLFFRFFQETPLSVSLPATTTESDNKQDPENAISGKKHGEKVLITPRTCLSCISLPPKTQEQEENKRNVSSTSVFPPVHVAHSEKIATVHSSLVQVTTKLLQSQLFDAVDANLVLEDFDVERNVYKGKVVLTVQEKGIPFLNFSSNIQASSSQCAMPTASSNTPSVSSVVGVELKAALRSPTGHGEVLSVGVSTAATGQKEYHLSLSVPAVGALSLPPWGEESATTPVCLSGKCSLPLRNGSIPRNATLLSQSLTGGPLTLSLRSAEDRSLSHIASLTQRVHSAACHYATPSARHQVHCEVALRDEVPQTQSVVSPLLSRLSGQREIGPAKLSPSAAVLSLANAGVRHSVKHIYTAVDTRPTERERESAGSLLQLTNELACHSFSPAAVATLVREPLLYVKNELHAQRHMQLFDTTKKNDGLTLSLAGSLGVLTPLNAALRTANVVHKNWCPLPDRYQLGGPLSLRGFDIAGVGVCSTPIAVDTHRDSLGGTSKASFLALLSSPAAYGTRAFLFLNGGAVGQGAFSLADLEKIKKPDAVPFFGYPRVSAGAGLSISFQNIMRLEMTYSLPVVRAESDVIKPFQIGIGLSIN